MSRINKLTAKLRKAPQPPRRYAGAPSDADRAKRPPLVQPLAPDSELDPGNRVEGLGNFGVSTGEFGTVEQTNEDDAVVKWDDDGRMRLRQPWLKKVSKKIHPLGRASKCVDVCLSRHGQSKSIGNYRCNRIFGGTRDPLSVALFVNGLAIFIPWKDWKLDLLDCCKVGRGFLGTG